MPTIDMIATGMNIRRLRNLTGLTNADLQRAFGFQTPQAIYKWYRGDSLPTVDNLVILADLFGVKVDEILIIKRIENEVAA